MVDGAPFRSLGDGEKERVWGSPCISVRGDLEQVCPVTRLLLSCVAQCLTHEFSSCLSCQVSSSHLAFCSGKSAWLFVLSSSKESHLTSLPMATEQLWCLSTIFISEIWIKNDAGGEATLLPCKRFHLRNVDSKWTCHLSYAVEWSSMVELGNTAAS